MLIKIGRIGEIKENSLITKKSDWSISKPIKGKLQLLGIECEQTKEYTKLSISQYPLIFETWKMLSENDDEQVRKITRVIAFIHGRYTDKKYRAIDFFNNLIDNKEVLVDLENYFEDNLFECFNVEPGTKTRYALVKWLKEYPKNEMAYMRVYFDWRKKDQIVYEFRLPQFRVLLNYYAEMEENLKNFVFKRLKDCDACGYCTQMDKSGKRKKSALELAYQNEVVKKCPLYPNFTWNYMNKDELLNIIRLYEFSYRKMYNKEIV